MRLTSDRNATLFMVVASGIVVLMLVGVRLQALPPYLRPPAVAPMPRIKSNMLNAIFGGRSVCARRRLVCSALESDVDIYTIIFAALVGCSSACSCTVSSDSVPAANGPSGVSALTIASPMIAAVLGTVNYVAYRRQVACGARSLRRPHHNHQRVRPPPVAIVRGMERIAFAAQPASTRHPQITLTAFRAISLSSVRRAPARARMAMVCIVADARTASAAGSASGFSSPLLACRAETRLQNRRRSCAVPPRHCSRIGSIFAGFGYRGPDHKAAARVSFA